jgi:CHAT domain
MPTLLLRVDEHLDGDANEYPVVLMEGERLLTRGSIRGPPEAKAKAIRETLVADAEPDPSWVDEMGLYLWDLLGDVGDEWSQRAAEADREGSSLSVLLDVRPEALALLPWEIVMDRPRRIHPFGREREPIARVKSYDASAGPPEREFWPLRILVVIGSDDPNVQAEQELIDLEDALVRLCAHVDIEVLDRPTPRKLSDTLAQRRPHILHFIGHGVETDGAGALRIENGDGTWDWKAQTIRQGLNHPPRLVILNACRTGGAAAEERGPDPTQAQYASWDVAGAFMDRHVPGVISMQGPIDSADAREFTEELYTALANREPIDVAVARGRARIANREPDAWQSRQTWLPSLAVSAPPEHILPPRYRIDDDRFKQVQRVLRPLDSFVDRREDRRTLLERLDLEDPDPELEERLVIVTGDENAGKTELVRWALAQLSYRGYSAVYVDLRSNQERGFLDVLKRIQNAVLEAFGLEEGAETPLDDFRIRLRGWLDREKQPVGEDQSALARDLMTGVQALTEDTPLAIAFDHIDGAEINRRLLEKVVHVTVPPARVILVHRGTVSVDERLQAWDPVRLTDFEPGDVKPLIRQYMLFHGAWDEALEAWLDTRESGGWRPSLFPLLRAANAELPRSRNGP